MKNGTKNVSKARASKSETGARIPLKRICADLGIETKPARVKLRRYWREADAKGRAVRASFHEKNDRWLFSPARAKEVRALLAPAK